MVVDGVGEILGPPLEFSWKPKITLKNKVLKLKKIISEKVRLKTREL